MKYDVIIVGMGIAGITAAIYAKRSGLNCLLLEKEVPGGILNKISKIENYPGYKMISGPDLAFNLFEQVNYLKILFRIEEVINIEKRNNEFIIFTNKNEYKSDYVILATGRETIRLGLNSEEKLIGKGISNCALCDGYLYKDEVVAIVGSNPYALEEAIELSKIVRKLYLIHGGKKLPKNEWSKLIDTIDQIEVLNESRITNLNEEEGVLKALVINEEKTLEVKALFEYLGYKPNVKYLKNFEITNKAGNLMIDSKCETSVENLYGIGDAVIKPVYQLITATNDGLIAITEIKKKMNLKKLTNEEKY